VGRGEGEMGKDENFKTESLAFTEKVKNIKDYDEERWFSSAYSTLNARFTVEGGGLSEEVKKTLKSLLFSSIENLKSFSVGDYDKWFYELAKGITDRVAKLSFGHAQKLINILMKYHFVYFYSGFDEDWKKKHLWLVPYFGHFHAPIDRKVLKNLTEKYSMEIPPNKFSWTKWQWTEKVLYEEVQNFVQKIVENAEMYYDNRLYFEMKELWKNLSEVIAQRKGGYGKGEMMERAQGEDSIRNFVEEMVNEINSQGYGAFELNVTTGYFSIKRAGKERIKNVVCFVKNEHVASISKYANIEKSLFDNPPYFKLKKRTRPPRWLQLREKDLGRYPNNVEYDLKEDKDVIFQLCKKACENFPR
jgi:hypothetical protein